MDDDDLMGSLSKFVESNSSEVQEQVKTPTEVLAEAKEVSPQVLIIDDLGVIIHQLSMAFQKRKMTSIASKEIFDALGKVKKGNFEWIIMDLFIPTDREGLMLLVEMKKIIKLRKLSTKIVIITASPKKEYKKICLSRGADYFIEKTADWQAQLGKICFDY